MKASESLRWLNVASVDGNEALNGLAKDVLANTKFHPVIKQMGKASFDEPTCIEPVVV